MPFGGAEKGVQRAGHDRSDSQTVVLRISAQQTHSGRRELQGYGYGCLGDLDRLVELCGLFKVTLCLPQRQIELAREVLRSFGQLHVALEKLVSGVQLSSLVCLGRSGHQS